MQPTTIYCGIVLPPTSSLAQIKTLSTISTGELQASVDYLRLLYQPGVRGSRRRKRSYSRDEGNALQLEEIRADTFEQDYAMRWLNALNRALNNSDLIPESQTREESLHQDAECETRQKLIDSAAALLASCAGTSASGTITRHFTFTSVDENGRADSGHSGTGGVRRVQLDLTDAPLINDDYESVGVQTWGGACVLTEMIVENPPAFGLPIDAATQRTVLGESSPYANSRCLKILELGSGTGLVGLGVAKLLQADVSVTQGKADCSLLNNIDVVLSDFHPAVLENLRKNLEANIGRPNYQSAISLSLDDTSHTDTTTINVTVKRLDWASFSPGNRTETPSEDQICDALVKDLGGPFDLIFGADIIYEAQHAMWIRACLLRLLAHSPMSAFHLVIPLRRTHSEESRTIEQVFSRAHVSPTDESERNPDLVILSEERFMCDVRASDVGQRATYDGADEVEYAHYKIGWNPFHDPLEGKL